VASVVYLRFLEYFPPFLTGGPPESRRDGQTIARGFNPGYPATNMTKSRRDGRIIPRFSGTQHLGSTPNLRWLSQRLRENFQHRFSRVRFREEMLDARANSLANISIGRQTAGANDFHVGIHRFESNNCG